jgi:hypothetical protein
MGTFVNEITGEINSSYTLITNEEVFDEEGKIKNDIIPSGVMGTHIILSSTEPTNPQEGDLWIQTE